MDANLCLNCGEETENLTYCEICIGLDEGRAFAELSALQAQNRRLREESDVLWNCISEAADFYRITESPSRGELRKTRLQFYFALKRVSELGYETLAETPYSSGQLHA